MSRWAVLLLLLSFPAALGAAQTPVELFREGNMLYQQGKVADARQRYEAIVARGLVSGELYYNLGNVCYRMGEIAQAILYYERALRLMPQDDDLQNNLQVAHLAITDRIDPIPRLFLWEWWDGIKGTVSLRNATWLMYSFYLLCCASAALLFLARTYRWRRAVLLAGAGLAVLFALSITLFVAKTSDTYRTDEAILLPPVVTVKNSPDPSSSDAFVLHSGVKVRITDTVGPWVKILLADGKVGWMERTGLEVI